MDLVEKLTIGTDKSWQGLAKLQIRRHVSGILNVKIESNLQSPCFNLSTPGYLVQNTF